MKRIVEYFFAVEENFAKFLNIYMEQKNLQIVSISIVGHFFDRNYKECVSAYVIFEQEEQK